MRTIAHVDMDAFFASVEVLDNPAYKGQPVIVGALPSSIRGVVSTCSYEAREFGVRSAMPIREAYRLCPHGIYVIPRMWRYLEISAQIHQIFHTFSPLVESISIDEAFLDMTGCEHFYESLEHMGLKIKKSICDNTGLTASVGIAPNKFLAKLASDANKPNGLTILPQKNVDSFLLPLPVGKLYGVGTVIGGKLNALGIKTVSDLRQKSKSWLSSIFGVQGEQLYDLARGIDVSPVQPSWEQKSISQERTFMYDITTREPLEQVLAELVYSVAFSLRKKKLYAKTVTLKIRFGDFSTYTRSRTLENSVNDDLSIYEVAQKLLDTFSLHKGVRLLGVGISNLTETHQLDLFQADQKSETINEVLDKINTKHSKNVIRKGRFW
jgi:DNA polymerase-4